MSEWHEQLLWFRNTDAGIEVVGTCSRETYAPCAVIDGQEHDLFLIAERDLLGDMTVRFACANGYAQYRVVERFEELWDSTHTFGYRKPVYRMTLQKARKR